MEKFMYHISFVVLIDTREGLQWLDSQFHEMWQDDQIQWLVLDRSDVSTQWKTATNIRYYKMPSESTVAQCYNAIIDDIQGEYVCFTNQYVHYTKDLWKGFREAEKEYPAENLFLFNYRPLRKEKKSSLSPKNYCIHKIELCQTEKLYMFLPAYLIRTVCIGNVRFQDVCEEESGTIFLINLWKKENTIIFLEKNFCEYNKKLSRKSDRYYGCENKKFYLDSLKESYMPLLDSYLKNGEKIPEWLQRVVYYQLYFKYYSNLNVRHKFLLNDEEIQEFFAVSKALLQYVNPEYILNNEAPEQFAPPFCLRNLFIYLKYDGDTQKLNRSFFLRNGVLYFQQCGCEYNLSAHQDLKVMAFNIRNGKFCIDMRYFTHLLYDYAPEAIYAVLNGKKYNCVKTDVYALDKVFGVSIEKSYTFLVEFPLEDVLQKNTTIRFCLELQGETVNLPLSFFRAPSKLNNRCPHSYWRLNETYTLVYEYEQLQVKAFTDKELKQREKQYVKEAMQALQILTEQPTLRKAYIRRMKCLRKAYMQQKPKFAGRRIWLFFDKLYKAGDNGEYAFRHAVTRNDGIECYYIINKDAPEYKRLKKEFKHQILTYNSFQCQLYALMAENIIATHPDIIEFLGFNPKMTSVMKDLFQPNLICIAHGITIQKNADYQNRLFDNTMFYTTSSKYEVNHILQPIYGYRPDEVALTGLARFDGLKNNDKRQILITPTWRRNLVGKASRNSTRKYADSFKETNYYKIYNRLINDERLITCAKKTGYRIIFLLHPSMSAQIDDYDKNNYVDLIQASGDMSYEKILTESSLMVTDYSGIHYDFGYMRKPIVYYQPKEVPMRFEEGGMKFATMGFGPLCIEYEDAVQLICKFMENECRIPEEYKRRADDFFAFDDFNNSQRIYDAVLQWTEERRNAWERVK